MVVGTAVGILEEVPVGIVSVVMLAVGIALGVVVGILVDYVALDNLVVLGDIDIVVMFAGIVMVVFPLDRGIVFCVVGNHSCTDRGFAVFFLVSVGIHSVPFSVIVVALIALVCVPMYS